MRLQGWIGMNMGSDNIMLGNNNTEEAEECFLEAEGEDALLPPEEVKLELSKRLSDHLPANELRTVRRPENMAPRTFFLDCHRSLLPDGMDRPCLELPPAPLSAEPARLKLRIVNSKNLSLEEYFARQRFRCLYNRLQAARPEGRTFLGRLKDVDSLVDYNWKNFRELSAAEEVGELERDRLDADFEGGNMCRAYVGAEEREYYLLVENDVNTYGYNNWFFFRCSNAGRGVRRFTLANLAKKTSFFAQGMAISVFSRRRWQREGVAWFKGGDRITFAPLNFVRTHHDQDYYSGLAFEYDFTEQQDEVFFALNQPYTYSRLVHFLHTLSLTPFTPSHLEVKNIGYSISNNIIPALRISRNPTTNQVILVIARQHPCETTGSFIAEYLVRQLVGEGEVERALLAQFEFVVVPMVNPDGVVHGMSRCNMAGLDLNRQWGQETVKELTPEVVRVKQLIASLSKQKRIKYMVDLHGHGKKLSSFFFCCASEREHYRLLSLAMKRLERRFSLAECTWGITRDKENTIRSKINSMGIAHSYTLETSLYGWRNPQGEVRHFNEYDYEEIARSLLKSIFLLEAPQSMALSLVGTTKDMLLSELGSLSDPAEQLQKAPAETAELLSDSDPEGDRLDVKELLGRCENKALKKQLEQLERRGRKRSKTGKLSSRPGNKDMRESCPTGFYSGKLSSALGRELIGKLEAKSNAKKVSFSEKWEERRQRIVQRQEKLKSESVQREMAEAGAAIAERQRRARIKSEISSFVDRRMVAVVPSATAKHTLKKKPLPHKMKTEFRQAEEMLLGEQEIQQSEARKSALELRFKQLKQESLNVILTDTLSISKVLPAEKDRPLHRSIHKMARPMQSDSLSKAALKGEAASKPFEKTHQYKKFKQFLALGQSPTKKTEKSIGSVFYYFPVL